MKSLFAALAIAAVLTGPAEGQPISLTDGTFTNADWTLSVFFPPTVDTLTAGQVTTGGNPGPHRAATLTNLGQPRVYDAVSFHSGFTYTPAAQGAIAAWSFRVDQRLTFESGRPFALEAGLAIRQGGVTYRTAATTSIPPFWITAEAAAPNPSAFVPYQPFPTDQPNFVDGGPIEFGFLTRFTVFLFTSGVKTVGADNFAIAITPVPEPSVLLLAGAGLVVAVRRR